jgi:tryptophanyl-tRNA synthetase
MKQFVDLQDDYESYIFIADYHALHTLRDPKMMNENIKNVLLDYLAIGLDPKKVTIYKQSDISEHTELAWIFDTLVTMPYLMRAHAFKDAEAKNKEISVGTFNYPVLQSADILMYDADVVPVGADQKQHIEIARDIALKFNNQYGETFKLPESLILENVSIVPGTDGQKMSKSYGNIIPLFGTKDEVKKAVMSIVTDSGEGIPENVYNIHKLLRSEEELQNLYEEKKGKYKDLKEALLEDIEKLLEPMREKRAYWEEHLDEALEILKSGGEKMKLKASIKMSEVREKLGVTVY